LLKKSYLIGWVFTAMQSVHIRMNSSLNPPLKNPGSAYGLEQSSFRGFPKKRFRTTVGLSMDMKT